MHELQTSGRKPLMAMLGVAVGILLLIAGANTAWLFSARAVDRRSESAVRVALGAGRWRLMRQILTESVVLTLVGGGLGLTLAIWTLPALLSLQDEGWQAETDVLVIGAIVFVSVATGALCGLVPAFRHARLDPIEALQSGSRRLSAGRNAASARRLMVFAEVAICMMLLVTSGLLIRSLARLQHVELGFDPQNVLTAQVSMDAAQYTSAATVSALYERVLERVMADAGVESAAVVTNIPIDQGLNLPIRVPFPIDGRPVMSVDWRYATDGYFKTMRVPLRAGRDFSSTDQAASAPVVIVNDAFVKRFFPDGRALGRVIELAMGTLRDPREVVGVVANTQQQGLAIPPPPTMYIPVRQVPDELFSTIHRFFPMSWVVRYRAGATATTEVLGDAIRNIDPRLPLSRVRTMDDVIAGALARQRMQAVLLSVFGLVSILMAITALAGSILYAVMRQRRDIGLRLALGASTRGMLRAIAGENLTLAIAGIGAGVLGARLLRQSLQPFVFGVTPTDWATYAVAGVLLFGVAAAASLAAAAPVLKIDPAETLRTE
jgi:predicted permease